MKAVIYVRCATERNSTKYVDTQIKKCLKFAMDNGYETDKDNDIYVDTGASGIIKKRLAFQFMMERVEKDATVKAVIAYDTNRISRNLGIYLEFKSRLKKLGKKFFSVMEPFINGGSPTSQLMEMMMVSFAEFQRGRLKERIAQSKK